MPRVRKQGASLPQSETRNSDLALVEHDKSEMEHPETMPALDTISISGFKTISSTNSIKLHNINILIGANGAGKSNFIGVFAFLHAVRDGRLEEYVIRSGGADRLLHFGSRRTPSMTIEVSFQNGRNAYLLELHSTENDELLPIREVVRYWDRRQHPQPLSKALSRTGKEAGISEVQTLPVGQYVRRHFDRWRVYHFHDTGPNSPMKKTCDINDNLFLRSDGSNLASVLYLLRELERTAYELIRHSVQLVAPFFGDFILEPQRLNPAKIRLEWRHQSSDAFFDVASLSDGTLRFIALAVLFLQPAAFRPSVILVDEPELGLHPYAITLLAALVKQVAGAAQVIVSTQSALLLDHFQPEDVLVADRVDGGTRFTRLISEGLADWLESYSLGELWEKNEIGGRPGQE
jgi:predicted ATPase